MKLTLEKKLAHSGHPVLRWNMDNIFIRTDPAGNIKADKEKSTEKIVENLTSAGATVQEAATISAIASSTSDNAILKAISTAVQSGDVAQAAQAAKELAPTTSQQVMGVAQGVNNILSNVTLWIKIKEGNFPMIRIVINSFNSKSIFFIPYWNVNILSF